MKDVCHIIFKPMKSRPRISGFLHTIKNLLHAGSISKVFHENFKVEEDEEILKPKNDRGCTLNPIHVYSYTISSFCAYIFFNIKELLLS